MIEFFQFNLIFSIIYFIMYKINIFCKMQKNRILENIKVIFMLLRKCKKYMNYKVMLNFFIKLNIFFDK